MKLNEQNLLEIIEEVLEERCQKGYKTHPTQKTKEMFGKTYRNCVKAEEGKEPKKGTGKKPKGSSRRLYTDENPKDTVSVKFSSVQDIKDTLSKASFKSKSHARQSQVINLIHQRVRAAHKNAKDPKVKARLKKALAYAEQRKEASKEKTKRMNKEGLEENVIASAALAGLLSLSPSFIQALNLVQKTKPNQEYTIPKGVDSDTVSALFTLKSKGQLGNVKTLQQLDKRTRRSGLETPEDFKE